MSLEPSLSVIVANYNNEKFIRDCLESILAQTYKDLEIVVADDHSTDTSSHVIGQYEKKYPQIVKGIFNHINRGVAFTRHNAILRAKGKYITTLDSDDYYYDSRKLEKEVELMRFYKEKNDKDILAFSNTVMVTGDKTVIKQRGNSQTIKDGMIFDEITTRSCMIPRDFIMKRSTYFEVGGYDFSIPIYEDWDLKIRLARKYEFYFTGISGTAYRRHGMGLSSAHFATHIRWMKVVFTKNLYLASQTQRKDSIQHFKEFIRRMKIQYINAHLMKELDLHLRNGKKSKALKLYLRILVIDYRHLNFKLLLKLLLPKTVTLSHDN